MRQSKTTVMHVRVTPAEKRDLAELAARWRLKPSALLRRLARSLTEATKEGSKYDQAT